MYSALLASPSLRRALSLAAGGFVLETPGSVFSIQSSLAYLSLCDLGTVTPQRHPGARLASLGSAAVSPSTQIQRIIRAFDLREIFSC